MPYVQGKPIPDIFATRDDHIHKSMKRPIASAYAMSTLVSYEPYVKSTLELYFARLDELFANTGRDFDFGLWIQFFAWDVLTEITFSKRLGFIEKGSDISQIMENNWAYFVRTAPVRLELRTAWGSSTDNRLGNPDAVAGLFLEEEPAHPGGYNP
jgi:hypothetical protein